MTIRLHGLTANNLVTLGLLMAETSMKSGSESIKSHPIVKELLEISRLLFDAINRETYSKLSDRVKDLDKRRDRVYIGIRTYVSSMLYSLDDEAVAAATRIDSVLEKHGAGIEKMPFLEESMMLRKLLTDLRSPSLAADVEKIGLTPKLADLEVATTDFEEVFNDRTADQAAIKEQLSVTAQRRKLEEAIRNYLALANVMALNNPDWLELVKLLEPDIDRIKSTIAKPEKDALSKE